MSKEGISAYLTPAQMSKLNRLALNSRYVVEGTLAVSSAQRGASTELPTIALTCPATTSNVSTGRSPY